MCSRKLCLIVGVILLVLLLAGNVLSDRLVTDHRNYFEMERDSAGSRDTTKFFPFGWWYHPVYDDHDTTQAAKHPTHIDSMCVDYSKYNVSMPTMGISREKLLRHYNYGVEKGLYCIVGLPSIFRNMIQYVDIFKQVRTTKIWENPYNLYKWGWASICSNYCTCTSCDEKESCWEVDSFKNDIKILSFKHDPDDVIDSSVIPHWEDAFHILHIESDDTAYTFRHVFDGSEEGFWYYEDIGYKFDWLTFKVRSDQEFRDSSYTLKFVAKYNCRNYADTMITIDTFDFDTFITPENDTVDTTIIDTTGLDILTAVKLDSRPLSSEEEGFTADAIMDSTYYDILYDTLYQDSLGNIVIDTILDSTLIDTYDVVTLSLQNTDYFSDSMYVTGGGDTIRHYPLYGSNWKKNQKDIIDLYDEAAGWYIVFAEMDKIIQDFTPGTYELDSLMLIDFEFVGSHYYLGPIGYSIGFSQMEGYGSK